MNTYIESQGKNPHTMTDAEREEHKRAMVQELYPGGKHLNDLINKLNIEILKIPTFKVLKVATLISYPGLCYQVLVPRRQLVQP